MDIRKKILETRLWHYFGGNPDAISVEAIEVLERNSDNIRRIARSNARFDALVASWIKELFTNDDESVSDVLESVAKDLKDRIQNQSKGVDKSQSLASCISTPKR